VQLNPPRSARRYSACLLYTSSTTARFAAEGSGSEVEFDRDRVDNSGWIKANDHGTVQFFDTTVDNSGGTIAAYGHSSVVELANTTIKGGTLTTDDSTLGDRGIIEIVASPHDGSNTTVFDGSHDAVTIAGFVQVDAGANLELKGTIDLDKNGTNGTIDLVDPEDVYKRQPRH